jgi:uncharacterized protein (TIGR00369 family)
VSDLLERIRAFRAGDSLGLVDYIPYARFLGFEVIDVDGEMLGRMRYADHLIGNPGIPALHGGTLGALLETAAIFEVLRQQETLVLPKTINLTVDYLRSGRPVDTLAKGVITKHGRRVVNVRAEAWQDDRARPIAIAIANFLIE